MKNIWTAAATAFALAAIVGIPVAAQQSASSFAAARQANYKEIGGAFVKCDVSQEADAQANALNTAAGSRDIAAMRAARDRLGATCKSCHDKYREPS